MIALETGFIVSERGSDGNGQSNVYVLNSVGHTIATVKGKQKYRIPRARLFSAAAELFLVLEVVRDADEDCRKDGLPTMPGAVRSRIDAALAKAAGPKS